MDLQTAITNLIVTLTLTVTAFATAPDACVTAQLANWPQWHGPSRDNISKETGLMKSWPPNGPELLWSIDGLGVGFSTVSVANGLIYTTGLVDKDGILFAVDLHGNLQWKKSYGPGWRQSHPGARTTPTIDSGNVYVVSGLGRVVCFCAKTGEQNWAVDTLQRFNAKNINWGISESVLIDGNNLICTPGGEDATVVALNKITGQTVWTSKGLSDRSAYCSPILVRRGDKRLIVTVTARSIVGLEAETGKVLWQYQNKLHQGKPREVNPNTPIYHDGRVYTTSRFVGGIQLSLSDDGTKVSALWENEQFDPHHGGAVLVDGYIYGANTKKDRWMCLDWNTGKTMYKAKWLGKGSLTYVEGMLYCYEEKKGTVALVKASPSGFNIVSSFEVPKGTAEHWAHPVICGGRLYIRHGDTLMAYHIKAKQAH